MSKLLTLMLFVLNVLSFPLFANVIESKADLENMVNRYEDVAILGKECTSSEMKDVRLCNRFTNIYQSGLKDEFEAMPGKLGSYIEIDLDITLRGISALTSITESMFDIYEHNHVTRSQ